MTDKPKPLSYPRPIDPHLLAFQVQEYWKRFGVDVHARVEEVKDGLGGGLIETVVSDLVNGMPVGFDPRRLLWRKRAWRKRDDL